MEISFHSSRLRKLCNDGKLAAKRFGDIAARKLQMRLDDLDAADSHAEFRRLGGHCEELKGNRKGQLSLRLAGGLRIVFLPVPEPAGTTLDWTQVHAV